MQTTILKYPAALPRGFFILKESFPHHYLTADILKQVVQNFRSIYDESEFEMTKPFPGIEAIIKDNQTFVHHIVTNKPDMPTMRILEKLGWNMYIATVSTPYGKEQLKSKSELFLDVASKYDKYSSFIGIGDMKSDCIAAKDNNIKSIGVLWGTGTREELSDYCDYLVDNTKQLYDFLHKMVDSKGVTI